MLVLCLYIAMGWFQTLPNAAPWSFAQFQTSLTKVSLRPDLSHQEAEDISAMSTLVGRIHDEYVQAFGPGSDSGGKLQEHLSPQYIQSLVADNSALSNLPSAPFERAQVLSEIRRDLQLKADLTSSTLNASAAFPSVVTVTVDTQRNGKSVGGLWVRANPRRLGVTAQPVIVFNSASTPTSAMLPPGLFILWVESADKTVLASQPIAVGVGGKDTEQIVFALP
jgi:hypothetical protein